MLVLVNADVRLAYVPRVGVEQMSCSRVEYRTCAQLTKSENYPTLVSANLDGNDNF